VNGCTDGTIAPSLTGSSVRDLAGNYNSNVAVTSPAVTLDSTVLNARFTSVPPSVTRGVLTYNLHFTHAIVDNTFTTADLANVSNATGCVFAITATNGTTDYRITVSDCSDGFVTLQVKRNTITDTVNNVGPINHVLAATVEVDSNLTIAGATVAPIQTSPTNYADLTFQVNFSTSVTGLTATSYNFEVNGTGCGLGSISGQQPSTCCTLPVVQTTPRSP
jgi:hypothetical protein